MDWVRLLTALWPDEHVYVLYVLLVPRLGKREPGRYESPPLQNPTELHEFLDEFGSYFAGDGRHHVWFMSQNDGQIVYDNHNLFYIYGNLDQVERMLIEHGATAGEVIVPAPHFHSYRPEFDADENHLMQSRQWKYFPLAPNDDPQG